MIRDTTFWRFLYLINIITETPQRQTCQENSSKPHGRDDDFDEGHLDVRLLDLDNVIDHPDSLKGKHHYAPYWYHPRNDGHKSIQLKNCDYLYLKSILKLRNSPVVFVLPFLWPCTIIWSIFLFKKSTQKYSFCCHLIFE